MKKKKLIKKIFKWSIGILGIFITLFCLGAGIIIGHLYFHPIEIKDYLSTIEGYILPPDSGWHIETESMILKAKPSFNGIFHIVIKDMKLKDADKHPFLKLPSVVLSYRLTHLITWSYIPDNINVKDADLRLLLDENNQIYLSGISSDEDKGIIVHKDEPSRLKNIFDHLLSFHGPAFENSRILIDNKQKKRKILLSDLNIDLDKEPLLNHALDIKTNVKINKQETKVHLQSRISKLHQKLSFDLEWDKFKLSSIGNLIPVLTEADLVTKGHFKGIFSFDDTIKDVVHSFKEGSFQIQVIQPGTLNLPDPLTNLYHIEKGSTINGAIGKGLNEIKVGKSTLYLKNGPHATLDVQATGIGDFLNGGPIKQVKTLLKSEISRMPIEKAPSVWPVATGPDAHAWVKANLSKGFLKKANFTLNFTGDELTDVYGEIPAENITVRYLDEMPPLNGFNGLIRLWLDKLIVTGKEGYIDQLKLTDANITLTELQSDISHADIKLSVAGPVKEAMQLISEKPLEFPQMFGFDAKETGGNTSLNVALKFPLIDNLKTKDVIADVNVKITDGVFPTPLNGKKLTDGKLDLTVTNKKLSLKGSGLIAEIPFSLEWVENFLASKPTDIQSQYNLNAYFDSKLLRGIDPSIGEYIDGNLSLKSTISKNVQGLLDGNCQFDFKDSLITITPISLEKEIGIPATGDLTIKNDGKDTTLNFSLSGSTDVKRLNPIQIQGSAKIGKNIEVNLEKVIAPKTDLTAYINVIPDQEINLKVKGNSWNAVTSSKGPKNISPLILPPNINFDIDLKRLILIEDKPLTNILFKGMRKNNLWESLSGSLVSYIEPFNIFYNPKTMKLTATTNDMGDLLERLDLTKKFSGGHLDLEAVQSKTGSFEGQVTSKNFEMKDPGFLVQAATILGVLDGIFGNTLKFDKMELPFQLFFNPSLRFVINEGYMAGSSLGITFDGSYAREKIEITGSVIPAYAINSLPGRIPLIGGLFKNGKGGGLVGARYELTGTQAKREIDFKPLSSMAPGILGKIFD